MSVQQMTLPVQGMTCASCVNHVSRALGKVPGVAEAQVNLATEKATVRFDNGKVPVVDLVKAVHNAGYAIPTEETTLPIGGMTCASCASHVERALNGVPGVVEAGVNLATEKATVTFVPGVAELKQAVARPATRCCRVAKRAVERRGATRRSTRKSRKCARRVSA